MHKARNISVLIIEDNPGDQLLLQENLESTNLTFSEIVVAGTFEEGLLMLSKKNFSVLFLDLFLPDSQGLDSISRMIKRYSNLPVIIYSGLSDTQMALDAIAMGAQDFLIKGDYTNILLEKIVRYSIERKLNLDNLEDSNARYTLLSKATHDMVWDWDLITDQVYRNAEGLKKIFDTDEQSEIGSPNDWMSKVHPEDILKCSEYLSEVVQSETCELLEIEYRLIRENGSIVYIEDRGYIIRNDQGKAIRMLGASHDITDRKIAEEKLELEKIIKKNQITEAVYGAQENERSEIGRELHDNVNQLLGATQLYITMARGSANNRDEMLKNASTYTLNAIEEIRKLSKTLITPLIREIGLADSIKDLSEEIMLVHPVKINFTCAGSEEKCWTDKFQLNIYRIIQEQLNNILKHARAKVININIDDCNDTIRVSVDDDGVGFDTSKRKSGVGLTNIKTRSELFNGEVKITSSPGNGTLLSITFQQLAVL